MKSVSEILKTPDLSKEELVFLLESHGAIQEQLFAKAEEVKKQHVGDWLYLRGLVEFSNVCSKNCLYCGIRRDNHKAQRYTLSDAEVLRAARYAYSERMGSLVLQCGERSDKAFVERIEKLLKKIHAETQNSMGITLSLGEQSRETYLRWREAGAHRYLLRIESSDRQLYQKIHPKDALHDFDKRLEALHLLRQTGYQTGTGVMIGLPFQSSEHLANDLLFMKNFGIDMVGMGPYIEHKDTPLFAFGENLKPLNQRFELSLKMIALLRIIMPDINIAAATALQAIDPKGREKALKIGANVMMPNITPGTFRDSYALYENKPRTDQNMEDFTGSIEARAGISGAKIAYGKQGNSAHFEKRTGKKLPE